MATDEEVHGQYIRVQLEETNFLHFAEIEVFHRVNFRAQQAQRLYSFDNADHPDYVPEHDSRDRYSACTDDEANDAEMTHEVPNRFGELRNTLTRIVRLTTGYWVWTRGIHRIKMSYI